MYEDITFQVIRSRQEHHNGEENITIEKWFEYDHAGRLLATREKINDPGFGDDNDLFGMQLFYNSTSGMGGLATGDGLYNGNISGIKWGIKNELMRGYIFTYDDLNRMLQANYAEGSSLSSNNGFFSESISSYDKNGNIKGLQRKHNDILVDNLVYTYFPKANRLQRIADSGTASSEIDDYPGSSQDYSYDNNGNMVYDGAKNLSVKYYSTLNLPQELDFGSNNRLFYHYTIGGAKLIKHSIPAEGTETLTHYIGNVIYEGGTLSYILTDEGRIIADGTGADRKFLYEYNLKDHLGNTRVSFMGTNPGGSVDVVQTTSYYPFGLVMNQTNGTTSSAYRKNKYLYNGKELQDDVFAGSSLNLYDYGARFYDPQIGRWTSPDPLSEANRKWSPYRFGYDNPMRFLDPDGMLEDDYKLKQDGSIEFVKSTNSATDELYATKKDGSINKDNSISVKKGTFSNEVEIDPIAVTGGGCSREKIVGEGEGYQIDNTKDASKVFKFASDNTSIEFGLIETNGSGSVLLTNHTKDAVAATNTAVNMSNEGKQINEVTHSHPINVGPSVADKTNAGNFSTSQGKAVSFNIYQPKSKMVIGYNKNGMIFQMNSTLFYGK